MKINYNINELDKVAKSIIELAASKVVLLYGEMGAGKTTLTKEICKQLGVEDHISSPTFSLVNEYQTNSNELIYHFDFYRIEDEDEASNIGFDEYIDSQNWCLIEWPINIKNLLPLNTTTITIEIIDEHTRTLELVNL